MSAIWFSKKSINFFFLLFSSSFCSTWLMWDHMKMTELPNKRNEHRIKFKSSRHHPCRDMYKFGMEETKRDRGCGGIAVYPKIIFCRTKKSLWLLFISFTHSFLELEMLFLLSWLELLFILFFLIWSIDELITREKLRALWG